MFETAQFWQNHPLKVHGFFFQKSVIFYQTKIPNLSTKFERTHKEMQNECFSFEIGNSKFKL